MCYLELKWCAFLFSLQSSALELMSTVQNNINLGLGHLCESFDLVRTHLISPGTSQLVWRIALEASLVRPSITRRRLEAMSDLLQVPKTRSFTRFSNLCGVKCCELA
jgi:hypothetical protein